MIIIVQCVIFSAWHQNSGSLPGHESPGLWSPQQPQIVQRHFSANAYTAGGQRKLVLYTVATNAAIIHGQVARQLSGTPILTAEFPRQNTPDAYVRVASGPLWARWSLPVLA